MGRGASNVYYGYQAKVQFEFRGHAVSVDLSYRGVIGKQMGKQMGINISVDFFFCAWLGWISLVEYEISKAALTLQRASNRHLLFGLGFLPFPKEGGKNDDSHPLQVLLVYSV